MKMSAVKFTYCSNELHCEICPHCKRGLNPCKLNEIAARGETCLNFSSRRVLLRHGDLDIEVCSLESRCLIEAGLAMLVYIMDAITVELSTIWLCLCLPDQMQIKFYSARCIANFAFSMIMSRSVFCAMQANS